MLSLIHPAFVGLCEYCMRKCMHVYSLRLRSRVSCMPLRVLLAALLAVLLSILLAVYRYRGSTNWRRWRMSDL